MGYIIKYGEITELYNVLTTRNILILGNLKKIEEIMNRFSNENVFCGEYADKIKRLFKDVQLPILYAVVKVYSSFPSYLLLYLGELMTIESNPEAIISEELLTEVTVELQKAVDFVDEITYNVNLEIDSIKDFTDISPIATTIYQVNGFATVKEKIDLLLQGISDIETTFYSKELYKLENLLDSLTTVIERMPQTGSINLLEDDYNNIFPLEEIKELNDDINEVNLDDKREYIEYIRRLCDAKNDYEIKDNYSISFVTNLIKHRCAPSMDDIRMVGELTEFYLCLCEYFGERFLYKWNDTKMLDWLYSYIPNHISDETLIYAMTLMSTPLDSDTIQMHLEHNRELWLKYIKNSGVVDVEGNYIFEEGYIDGQGYLDEMFFGVDGGSIGASNNTCEIIALYNALYYINDGVASPKYDFPELIAQMEGRGPCLNGILGTSPVIIEEYLKDEGYNIKTLEGKDARDQKKVYELQGDYDTYIVTLYNDENDVSEYIHTMCITRVEVDGEIKYMLRNDGKKDTLPQDSIYDCLEIYKDSNSKNICIIGVSN